jgi:hypothetical protein
MFPVRSNANFARLPRGISTAICTSPSSVEGGKLGHGERPIDLRCGAEGVELTRKINVIFQKFLQGKRCSNMAYGFL